MTATPPLRHVLRQSPTGYWYMIPFHSRFDWERWCRAVRSRRGNTSFPEYAVPTNPLAISFESPRTEEC